MKTLKILALGCVALFGFSQLGWADEFGACEGKNAPKKEITVYRKVVHQIKKTPRIFFLNDRSYYKSTELDSRIEGAKGLLESRFGSDDITVTTLGLIADRCPVSDRRDMNGQSHGWGRHAGCVNGYVDTVDAVLETRICD